MGRGISFRVFFFFFFLFWWGGGGGVGGGGSLSTHVELTQTTRIKGNAGSLRP